MRVLQIINSFGYQSGGAERLVHDLHVDLLAAGVDAHLVALEECDASQLENAMSLGFSSSYKPGAILALRKYLGGLTPKPNVIHAHLFPTSAIVATLKKLGTITCPVVFTEHNTSNRRREKAFFKPIDAAVYREFERVYCISEGTKAALLKAYPKLRNKTEAIPNGATLRFDKIPARTPDLPVRILSIGRLSKQKNYPTALRAISMLEGANVKYTVLGEGADRGELEELVQSLKLTGKVTFEGHKSDIAPYLMDADIFLIPSLWEGFGLAAVEGMNAGLPVVAADVTGLREVVGTDQTCAFLVSPSDPQMIATALMRLTEDSQKRRAMGQAAFLRAKLFDKRDMTKRYISVYRDATRVVSYV